jgi:glycosyltransferase involved in cell wall biosynthesis
MRPLSIVHLFTHSSVTRGGAVQGLLLVRTLQERGHRVISFFHAPYHRSAQEASASFQPFASANLDIRWINMKNPLNYFRFWYWLQRERVDILHTHNTLALFFAYFSTLGLSSPPLVANRGTTYPLPNLLARHVYHSRRLKHVIVVAQAVKRSLVEEESVDPDKISVVYGSFDEQRFSPDRQGSAVREAFQVPSSAPLIACIAAIDSRKGLDVLVQAAKEVTHKRPTAMFLVVGKIDDTRYWQRLQQEVERLGLAGHVVFTGHRTDIPEILAAADLAVNASTEGEGLTGALREALAMQKPVVCTAVCGNPELVQDGESGWVVEPGNAHALAMAILDVLQHPEEANRRAHKGYQWVFRHCTNARRCRQVEQIYYALCPRCPGL